MTWVGKLLSVVVVEMVDDVADGDRMTGPWQVVVTEGAEGEEEIEKDDECEDVDDDCDVPTVDNAVVDGDGEGLITTS